MLRARMPLSLMAAGMILAGCGSDAGSGEPASNRTDPPEAAVTAPEQAVIVYLKNTGLDAVFAVEEPLEAAINDADVGEYDGNEVALDGSEAILYAYGPDADALWDVMRPVIVEASPNPGSYAIKRYGEASDASAKEMRVEL